MLALGCQTQFAVDVRLPLPAACPDCGADVLAPADIEGPDRARDESRGSLYNGRDAAC